MKVVGYKAFDANKTNRYGTKFEEGKDYHIDGKISFGVHGNGFHMCKHLSDVFRFYDSEDCVVAKVIGSGTIVEEEMMDWTEPYCDMYSVSDLHIEKFLSKEDIINIMLTSSSSDAIKFLATYKLNEEEALQIIRKFRSNMKVISAFLYYYAGIKDTYYLGTDEREKKLKKVYGNGQNHNQGCQGK